MSSNAAAFQAFLQQQRVEYQASLPRRRAQLEAAWAQALAEPGALLDLERCAHTFAGSGATFGYAELGAAGRALEEAVADLAGAPLGGLAPLYQALLQRIEEAAGGLGLPA